MDATKRRLRRWVLIGVLTPMLYVASFGPACWVTSWCNLHGGWILVMYRPIIWIAETAPVLDYVTWYSLAGASNAWGWEIDLDGHFTKWGPILPRTTSSAPAKRRWNFRGRCPSCS